MENNLSIAGNSTRDFGQDLTSITSWYECNHGKISLNKWILLWQYFDLGATLQNGEANLHDGH